MEAVRGKSVHHGFVVFTLMERGKAREAYSIHIRERVLQRVLSDYVLMPFIKRTIVGRNCASIKGKGEIYAENALKIDLHDDWKKRRSNDGWVVFLDVSKYFFNINRETIRKEFSCIGDGGIQNVIKQFSDAYSVYEKFSNGIGSGLGTQFVQISGIYAMSKIDHHIKECEKGGRKSTRYMDDTYIFTTNENKEKTLKKYIEKCESLGFPMNKEKCVAVPVNRPFVWLKKLYTLTDTGKVVVRIGYKTVTRERHAIMARKNWVNQGKISYFSYCNQARSWLINVRKHYRSTAPCLVIERTFQYCFYRLLEDNLSGYAKKLNNLIGRMKNENVVLLIRVCTLYMAFGNDAAVLSKVFGKKNKRQFYIEENKLKKALVKMENVCLNYIVAKENLKDELSVIWRVSSLNSYRYFLNG